MDIFTLIIIIAGLFLFETISSIDNAIINAQVLSTMQPKARRWFLIWGMIFAVFIIRGLLPWLIVWASTPELGPIGALTATFSDDPRVLAAIETSAPVLLMGGGTFLIFLFLHWLFLEEKNYGLKGEKFFTNQGVWFFAIASVLLSVMVWFALKINTMVAFGAVVGSTAFFITHGFKQNAEHREKQLMNKDLSDVSKIFYSIHKLQPAKSSLQGVALLQSGTKPPKRSRNYRRYEGMNYVNAFHALMQSCSLQA